MIFFFLAMMGVACSEEPASPPVSSAPAVPAGSPAKKGTFLLDADTGNEMDDLYAIVRGLEAPNWPLVGVASAHFNNPQLLTDSLWHIYPTKGIQTLEISQEINENLLQLTGRTDVPALRGSKAMVGYAWGYYEGAPIPENEAVQFIIEQGRAATPEAPLHVLVLGPATNAAAAILLAPEIIPNLHVWLLSMRFEVEKQVWTKNSFNARNDINALDLLLSEPELALTVMPGNVARELTFDRLASLEKLSQTDHPTASVLARRWDEVSAGDSWIMWDLALVEAVLHPEWASVDTFPAPPENGGRPIRVFTDIDAATMEADFWQSLGAD